MPKERLDQLLVSRGLAPSRQQAQALILAGQVRVGDRNDLKAGSLVDQAADIDLIPSSRYVSRGGDKLASVTDQLKLDFAGKVVLDVGSSTGGFTDFALQRGAKKVICVDVGTGQLAWQLRQDHRVEVHEQTDIRDFQTDQVVDMALVDVSFVSVLKILPSLAQLAPTGQIIVMVKPQFEAGKALADKYHGVIKDERVRQQILNNVRAQISTDFEIAAEADSELTGPKGNREHFMVLEPINY